MQSLAQGSKITHFMTAPDEVPVREFSAWLPSPGRSYSDESGAYDMMVGNGMYGTINTLEPEAFERLERFTDAIESAELLRARFPWNPLCAAKVGAVDWRYTAPHAVGVAAVAVASASSERCESPHLPAAAGGARSWAMLCRARSERRCP